MSRIAVTGAYGWIGRVLCTWIESQGHQVLRLDLRPGPGGGLVWDCTRDVPPEVAQALSNTDAVVHCAGHVHRPIETEEEKARFFDINREGTRRILEACRRSGPRRFVFVSTIALYTWEDDAPRTEDAPQAGATAYAESKRQAEAAVCASGLDWRIARLATVYGAGDRANFLKLASALARRRFLLPGAGSARKSVLPVNRAGELLGRLALVDDPAHRTLNLANPSAPTLAEICAAFAGACGFPIPRSVPLPVLRLGARLGDLAALLKPNFPLTSTNVRKLTTSTEVDIRRQQAVFPNLVWRSFADELREHAAYYREITAPASQPETASPSAAS